jgi:hypothetical protein
MGLFSLLFGSCSKTQPSTATPPANNSNAKADAEQLLGSVLPFAEKMLQQHHEFFPFGGHMTPDGKIGLDGTHDGAEHPPSQTLIDQLQQSFQQSARTQNLRSCAIVYDIRTVPPCRTEKQDAIAALVDHVSGYSVVVVYPYKFDGQKKLQVEAPFATEGSYKVFGRPPMSTR